jgi:DNA-binding transcriptional LysR family regulator
VVGLPIAEAAPLHLTNGIERVRVPVWTRFACNDPRMNLELAARGFAIAPVSRIVAAPLLKRGDIVQVLPRHELVNSPAVYALYAGRTAVSSKITAFLDFLGEFAARIAADPDLVRL